MLHGRRRESSGQEPMQPRVGKGKVLLGNPYEGTISMTLGAGSLEGEGRQAAQEQNLGRSCNFLPEGKRFLKWLTQEGAVSPPLDLNTPC